MYRPQLPLLFPDGTTIDDVHLGYLYDAIAVVPELGQWTLQWQNQVAGRQAKLAQANVARTGGCQENTSEWAWI
jgi:hypothetical protein